MKKLFPCLVLILLLLPLISPLNLTVERKSSDEVVIAEFANQIIFDLEITNGGLGDSFEFYNLLGFGMKPDTSTFIDQDETKEIQLIVLPRQDFNYRGFYAFEYFIKNSDGTDLEQILSFEIINLEDSFDIGASDFDPDSNSVKIFMRNKKKINFEKINTKFSSAFFEFEEEFSLGEFQKKEFLVELNKEDFNKLTAGFYTLEAEAKIENHTITLEGLIQFLEKDIVTETSRDTGLVVSTKKITKSNEGNVVVPSEIIVKKNIISRLFTTFSPDPEIVERNGAVVTYTWTDQINPGETFEVQVKTNWLFPFLIILILVIVVVVVKQSSRTTIELRKKVSFVKAKGGEFALKVSIIVNAKKHVERVNVIDRLPPLVKIYERFGVEVPSRINEKAKRIEWNLGQMDQGESRIINYIIYSKIGIMGRFILPSALAVFETNGELHEVESNRAFFIAEQRSHDLED